MRHIFNKTKIVDKIILVSIVILISANVFIFAKNKDAVSSDIALINQQNSTASFSPSAVILNSPEPLTKFYSKSNIYSSIKWWTETIQEKNTHADIDIKYPQFIGGVEVERLNKFVSNLVLGWLSDDRDLVQGWIKDGAQIETDGKKIGYEKVCNDTLGYQYFCGVSLVVEYKVYSVVNDIVSLEIVATDYTGGGNGNHDEPVIINYDLKTNKQLANTALLCGGEYPRSLPPEVFSIIGRSIFGKEINDPEQEAKSITTIEDILRNILLGHDAIIIVYPPYQVSSGADGIIRIPIPYSLLNNIICLP